MARRHAPVNPRARAPRRKHAFFADASIPPDHKGNQRCRRCGLMGRPGDARHTDEFPETPAEDVSDRWLGERDNDLINEGEETPNHA